MGNWEDLNNRPNRQELETLADEARSEVESYADQRGHDATWATAREREDSLQSVLERTRDLEYAKRLVAAELECDISEVF